MRGVCLCFAMLLFAAACSSGSKPSAGRSSPAASLGICPPGVNELPTPQAGLPVRMCGTVGNQGTTDITTQGATVKLTIEMDTPVFTPTFIKATPGAVVELTLVNKTKPSEPGPTHTFTSDVLHVSQEVRTLETKIVSFTLPSDGQPVRFYCIPHRQFGQQGAFYFG